MKAKKAAQGGLQREKGAQHTDAVILYQDAQLVVCVKPAGVLSENGGMPELLAAACGAERIYCVHRLDRDVGGVMVYAKTGKAAAALSAQFSAGAEKEYLAVAAGHPEMPEGEFSDLLFHDRQRNKTFVVKRQRAGVKQARLHYRTVASSRIGETETTLLRVVLHTGRTHQIRVQFASRGMPLLGDAKYGSRARGAIALWACALAFDHPFTGKRLRFSAQPPAAAPWTEFGSELFEKDDAEFQADAQL